MTDQKDLIELDDKSDRDLLVIGVVKLNAIEGTALPAIEKHLEKQNRAIEEHGNRLTAIETKCHETTRTIFTALDRRSNGSRRPPKKYVAGGVSVIVVMGSLGYAAGRIFGWW